MNKKLFNSLKSALEEVIAYKNITCKSDKMIREQRICAECGKDKPECAYITFITEENGIKGSICLCSDCCSNISYVVNDSTQETKDALNKITEAIEGNCITDHVFNDFWMVDKWGNPLK